VVDVLGAGEESVASRVSETPTTATEPRRSAQAARTVFLCALAASVPFYLFFARRQWFWGGEWTFLASRDLSSFHDLVRPYNQHWETIPIVVFQVLFLIFRLRTYLPYQLMVVVLHGIAGLLLWIVMRRAGIRSWLAAIAALAFVYFGHGRQDIVLAFQFGFDSALVLGLCAILLVDHPGDYDRRDVLAVVCGLLALLCSGVAVTMIVVAGVVLFFRRGLKASLVYTVPLAIVYLVWFVTIARADYGKNTVSSAGTMADFVASGLGRTLEALGSTAVAGWALAAFIVFGVALANRTRSLGPDWTLPLAFAVGALVFLTVTAFGRSSAGAGAVDQSRYVDITACLLLPMLAKSADTISRHYAHAFVAVLVVLLVGVPSNLAAAGPSDGSPTDRQALVAVATSPMAETADAGHQPDVVRFPSVTMGWLRNEVGQSGLPSGTSVDQSARAAADIRFDLQQFGLELPMPPCEPLQGRVTFFLAKHDDVSFIGQMVLVSAATPDGSSTVPFSAVAGTDGAMLRAVEPTEVTLHPAQTPVQVCRRATRRKG
jgi:hypothetical protein